MSRPRISRGTPYVLSQGDIDAILSAVPPRVEEAIATLMNQTLEEWRALDRNIKVKHILDFQNRSQLTAMLAAGARSHTDLEEAAFVVTRTAKAEHMAVNLKAMEELIAELSAQVAELRAENKAAKTNTEGDNK